MVEATDELRERLAKALHEAQCGCPTWVVKDLEDTQYDDMAAALLPLVVAVVAEARTEGAIAELEAAADLILAPSEHLRDSATCRDIAYDLHERAAALRGVGNQKVGVTVDDLALDEMDGNQNAEPERHKVCTCWRLNPDGTHQRGCDFFVADQKGTEQ